MSSSGTGTSLQPGRGRAAALTAAVALAGTVLAGCGSSSPVSNGESSKTPTTILSDAKAATDGASVVQIAGSLVDSGQHVSLDLVDGKGAGGGSLTESGATFQVVVKGATIYLKAPAATWTRIGAGSAASALAGRWLSASATSTDFSSFATLVDISKLTSQLTPSGTLTKGRTTTFDGRPAIPLEDRHDDGGTLYVASTGRPYILGITGSGGTSSGKLTFTRYGTAAVPAVPKDSESFEKVAQGG